MSKYTELVKRHQKETSSLGMLEGMDIRRGHQEEIKKEIEKDKKGNGFINDMFRYEMGNTEYHIREDKESVLDQIGITEEYINRHSNVKKGFELARKEHMKNYN